MKELLPGLYGNEKAKETLCFAIRNKRMPQTLILEGDKGSGKHTFALELAKALFCVENEENKPFPCGECRRCVRVEKSLTPDVVIIRADEGKASISVDKVREMTAKATVGPCEMPVLVFIVEGADEMNIQAQNAWLLGLENPPEDVVYILLCENSSKLLETIRSRSFVFRTERFSPETIATFVSQNTNLSQKYSYDEIFEVSSSANGSIGRAIMLLSEVSMSEFHKTREAVLELARALLDRSMPNAKRLRILYSLPQKRESLLEYFVLLAEIIHDVIMLKLDENANLSFFTPKMKEDAVAFSDSSSLKTLYLYRDALDECIALLKANASVSGVRTGFAVKTGIIN